MHSDRKGCGRQRTRFLCSLSSSDLQNVIWIDGGASLDPMGWPWLSPNLASEAALTDYNVDDKYKLGWITDGVCIECAMQMGGGGAGGFGRVSLL